MSYYRTLIMKATEENIMSVKLQPNMTHSPYDIKICEDYWAYDNQSGFIKHVKTLCEKYEVNPQVLFETVAQCYAYLDDVVCEYCGYACPIEVPADIRYMRAKDSWLCAICEHALWRTDKENK